MAIRGDDLAVRVTSHQATRAELVDILRRVRPSTEHVAAPSVPDPPAGLRVIGSVDADAVIALGAYVQGNSYLGGLPDSHVAGWIDGHRITVLTLPGQAADVDALPGIARFLRAVPTVIHHTSVGANKALVLEFGYTRKDNRTTHAVVTRSAWGDLLVVTAQGSQICNPYGRWSTLQNRFALPMSRPGGGSSGVPANGDGAARWCLTHPVRPRPTTNDNSSRTEPNQR